MVGEDRFSEPNAGKKIVPLVVVVTRVVGVSGDGKRYRRGGTEASEPSEPPFIPRK